MKNTKRLLTWILVAVLVVASFALVACVDKPQPVQLTELNLPKLESGQMAVIIKNGDNDYTSYVVTLGLGGAHVSFLEDLLIYLDRETDLFIDWEDGEYGKWINAIGGAVPTAANEYVEVFTSVEAEMGTWAGVNSYEIGDVLISSAAVGISELHVDPGVIIYFQVSTY